MSSGSKKCVENSIATIPKVVKSCKILQSSEHMSVPGKPVPVAAPGLALVLVHHASCPAVLGQICPAISAEVLVTGPTAPGWWILPEFGAKVMTTRNSSKKKRGFPWKNHLQNISEQCFQISTDVLMIWHDLTNLTIFGYQVYHDLRRFIMIYGVSIQLLGIILTEWTCWCPSTSPGVSHDTSVPGAEV